MGSIDFPAWFGAGSYGGLAVSLLITAIVAVFALRLRRGTPRQLARATLACLLCCCLMFAPILWYQDRFNLLGPTIGPVEVGFWLVWTALVGWGLPLSIAAGYLVLARPQPMTGVVAVPPNLRAPLVGLQTQLTRPDDPERLVEPLGAGNPWGQLVPDAGPFAQKPLPLSRQIILLGRELDCDIIVPDELASRHHAEIRWDHGRVQLVDRGSLNGMRVNGQAIFGQVPLRPGDVVEIGSTRYRFESIAEGVAPPPAATEAEETRKVPGAPRPARNSGPAPTPVLVLVALNGPVPGARWPIGSLTSIGRDTSNAVQLADSSVSRQHAQIVRQASGYYVQDVDSQNGTLLNGQPITAPMPLAPGDVLQVGEVLLACELAAPASGMANGVVSEAPRSHPADAFVVRAASSAPNTHTLLAPQRRTGDTPNLAPPRLVPSPPQHADG
jgi:pSer/pThr/pTyr-binding forkhead associated (FHA) protein